jgi:dephospho-CoA kinase
MDRIIIALAGSIASGKETLSRHFIELGFNHQILSDRLREEAHSRGLEVTRPLLQDIGNELRQELGGAVLAIKTAELIADSQDNVVIDGVRNPHEIIFLREVLGAVVIGVDAPEELRCQWYIARREERGEDGATAEDFKRDNDRDFGIGEPGNGQQVRKCLEMADVIIRNDGSKKQLYRDIDQFLKDFLDFDPEIAHSQIEKG